MKTGCFFRDYIMMNYGLSLVEEWNLTNPLKELLNGKEDGLINRWIAIDELDNFNIVPEFVKPELKILDLSGGIKHVISRSVR